jgi:pleiotropic regulator 1
VRALAVSSRSPFIFSAGEDKLVKCTHDFSCYGGFSRCTKLYGILTMITFPSAGWDMEQNKVIRHFHGHLSGVFCLKLHPTLDLLVTGGRDSVARVCLLCDHAIYMCLIFFDKIVLAQVWDIRTKHQIHVLGGHTNAVSSLLTNGVDPQVITGSHDSTIKVSSIFLTTLFLQFLMIIVTSTFDR